MVRRVAVFAVAVACFTVSTTIASAAPASWTVEASPNRGTGFNDLHDISCPSADFCMAVGQITPSAAFQNMGMRWNGHAWRSANPRSRPNAENWIDSVSCTGPTFCLAVGYVDLFTSPVTVNAVVERWDGTTWSIVPNPPGTKNSYLLGVSCPGPTTCFIVGDRATSKSSGAFERWDDGVLSAVNGSGLQPSVTDLACPSTTTCVAVGAATSNGVPLRAQTFDGTHWSDAGAPVPSSISALQNVSCASTTYCMATGYYYDWDLERWFPLVDTWNGTTWTQQANPPTPYGSNADVACPEVNDCILVGTKADGTTKFSVGMVLTWNGSQWASEDVPREGHFSNSLQTVSCWSADECRAAGTWMHDRIQQTLAVSGT